MNPSASGSELLSDFRVPRPGRRVTAGVTARVRIPKRGSVNRPESDAGSELLDSESPWGGPTCDSELNAAVIIEVSRLRCQWDSDPMITGLRDQPVRFRRGGGGGVGAHGHCGQLGALPRASAAVRSDGWRQTQGAGDSDG